MAKKTFEQVSAVAGLAFTSVGYFTILIGNPNDTLKITATFLGIAMVFYIAHLTGSYIMEDTKKIIGTKIAPLSAIVLNRLLLLVAHIILAMGIGFLSSELGPLTFLIAWAMVIAGIVVLSVFTIHAIAVHKHARTK